MRGSYLDALNTFGEFCVRFQDHSSKTLAGKALQLYSEIWPALMSEPRLESPSAKAAILAGFITLILSSSVSQDSNSDKTSEALKALLVSHADQAAFDALENLDKMIPSCQASTNASVLEILAATWTHPDGIPLRESLAPLLRTIFESLWTLTGGQPPALPYALQEATQILQSSPSSEEASLMIRGFVYVDEILQYGYTDDILRSLRGWIAVLRTGLHEDNDFSLRFACASSLHGFRWAWQARSAVPSALEAELLLPVYDCLIDDDPEIRELGSETCRMIMQSSGRSTGRLRSVVPALAGQALGKYLVSRHAGSSIIMVDALRRLTSQDFRRTDSIVSFEGLFKRQLAEIDSLFAAERQNLYVDDVEEARLWSAVLRHMDQRILPKRMIAKFEGWCIAGMKMLLDYSQTNRDGPLGWASKPAMFSLGMRLIQCFAVLLQWRTDGTRVSTRWSEMVKLLAKLDHSKQQELHCLWRREANAVLTRSITTRFTRVARTVSSLATGPLGSSS